jgi:hypothetical protein
MTHCDRATISVVVATARTMRRSKAVAMGISPYWSLNQKRPVLPSPGRMCRDCIHAIYRRRRAGGRMMLRYPSYSRVPGRGRATSLTRLY